MKPQLKIFIIIIVIAILTIGAVVFVQLKPVKLINKEGMKKQEQIVPAPPENMIPEQVIEYDNQVYQIAKDNKQVSACGYVVDEKSKDTCYYLLAQELSDKKVCGNISSAEEKSACFDTVIIGQARQQKNLDLCQTISDETKKDGCALGILDLEHYTADKCNELDGRVKELCISQVLFAEAVGKNDTALCGQIPLEDYKAECQGMIGAK